MTLICSWKKNKRYHHITKMYLFSFLHYKKCIVFMETSSLKPYDLTQEIFLFSSKTNCTHLGRLVFDQAQIFLWFKRNLCCDQTPKSFFLYCSTKATIRWSNPIKTLPFLMFKMIEKNRSNWKSFFLFRVSCVWFTLSFQSKHVWEKKKQEGC